MKKKDLTGIDVAENIFVLAVGLAARDWQTIAFSTALTGALLEEWPAACALVPRDAPMPENLAERIYTCAPAALASGAIAGQVAALVHDVRKARLIAIGTPSPALLAALAAQGLSPVVRTLTDAVEDKGAPPPLPLPQTPLRREAARAIIGAPSDRMLEVMFPGSGSAQAMAAMARIADLAPGDRPLFVLADDWADAAILRQYALLRGIAEDVRFCGAVPKDRRGALVAAAEQVHDHDGAGLYFGEVERLALAHRPDSLTPRWGTARAWARWALGDVDAQAPAAANPPSTLSEPCGVAVFVPSWRCRAWLPDAISGLLAQSHPNKHVFVCADGGEDIDADLVAAFPQVSFLATPDRVGPFAIVNMLAAISRSDCIAFQDADDVSVPQRIACQAAELERLRLDIVGSNSLKISIDGELIGVEAFPPDATIAIRQSAQDQLLHPSSMMRRKVVQALGGFDSSTFFGADTEFHFRAAFAHAMGNVPDLLYTRRARPRSLTGSRETGFGSDARKQYSDLVRDAFERRLEIGVAPDPGTTLSGQTISPPRLDRLRLIKTGTDCAPWFDQAARILV